MKLICKDEDIINNKPAVVELYDSVGHLGLWIEAHVEPEVTPNGETHQVIKFKQIYTDYTQKMLTTPDNVVQ